MEQSTQFDPAEHLIKVTGGSDYLEVKWRLVWFRSEHPNGQIFTEVQEHDREDGYARVKARVQYDYQTDDGAVKTAVAESTGTETAADFPDYLEKAETKAIGRALAALGFGTQFAEDFDMRNPDGSQHVVDAPVSREKRSSKKSQASQKSEPKSEQKAEQKNGKKQAEAPVATSENGVAESQEVECEECGQPLTPSRAKGDRKGMTVQEKAEFSKRRTGRVLCYDCYQDAAFSRLPF